MTSWKGRPVALTGRLASMDRATARQMIARLGGIPVERVSRQTAALVIGGDGWPLRRSGQPTKNLQRAGWLQRRGYPIEIVTEATFLRRLQLSDEDNLVQRLYTIEQISGVVKVSGLRLRRWVEAGLIRPEEIRDGVALFRFSQVASIRDLWRLIAAGCDTRIIRRSLERLSRWTGGADDAIADIQRFGRAIVMRTSDGGLIDGLGQRLFPFDDPPESCLVPWREAAADPQQAFDRAVKLEAVDSALAIAAYEEWLDRFGPDPAVDFNLANLLAEAGDLERAVVHYRQSLEREPNEARAWNNYGLALAELGRLAEASEMLARAVECDPGYADAYYNAADLFDLRGYASQARLMWLRYLRHESEGEHAEYARTRCDDALISTIDEAR